jgi:glucose 1-dehydrogenase
MGRLENKVAVITGAASGMGRGTAIRFAGEGAAVVIADLNEDGAAAAVRECRENGGNAVFQKTDVARESSVQEAVARALSKNSASSILSITIPGLAGRSDQSKILRWKISTELTPF